jgi:hypothetical protein
MLCGTLLAADLDGIASVLSFVTFAIARFLELIPTDARRPAQNFAVSMHVMIRSPSCER